MTQTQRHRQLLTLLLAAVVAIAVPAGFAGLAGAAGPTDLTVTAADTELVPGETTAVEVAVSNAQGGVGAASFGLELSDSSVAEITDVTVNGANPDIPTEGNPVDVRYFQGNTDDTGEVVFLTVTVEATASGTTTLSITENSEFGTLLVGDEEGLGYTLESIGTVTFTIEEPNNPPTADAGADQTVDEDTTATLDATGSSDDDGSIASYAWTQTGSGPSVTLLDTSAAQPTFTAPDVDSATDLTFEVTVTDDDGASDTDSVTVTVEPVAPASFTVENLNAPGSATQGDTIDVSAEVTNNGDVEATKTVEFRVDTDGDGQISDESALATQSVQLTPGTTETVTFADVGTSVLSPGTYSHGVVTPDDSATASIIIEAPPTPATFQVSNLDAPGTATAGDTIDVSADVENTGDEAGTQTVEFRLDADQDGTLEQSETLATQSLNLDSGETKTVTFAALDTSGLSGEYGHGVFTDDDSATNSITIEEPAPADDVSVSLEPADATVGVGGETTFDVVVSGLEGDGVGAFDLTVSTDDIGIASITDATIVAENGGEGSTDVTIAGDGSSAQLQAYARDTADTGSVTVATVTLSGVETGATTVDLSVTAIGDESGINYGVASATGANVEVQPASVEVSNLDAPEAAAPGQTLDVSAEVTNTGSTTVSRTVEFRLDLNGDGDLTSGETVATKQVTIGAGLSVTVNFAPTVPEGIALGEYDHGVFADTSQTATVRIAPPKLNPQFAGQPTDTDGDGTYEDVNGDGTVDEVDAQALFANLDNPILDEYEAQFDYNGNGEFDVVDVQYHFNNEINSGGNAGSLAGPSQLVGIVVDLFVGWV